MIIQFACKSSGCHGQPKRDDSDNGLDKDDDDDEKDNAEWLDFDNEDGSVDEDDPDYKIVGVKDIPMLIKRFWDHHKKYLITPYAIMAWMLHPDPRVRTDVKKKRSKQHHKDACNRLVLLHCHKDGPSESENKKKCDKVTHHEPT
jgi:hypothetical protein